MIVPVYFYYKTLIDMFERMGLYESEVQEDRRLLDEMSIESASRMIEVTI
jgi:hypothetical protein